MFLILNYFIYSNLNDLFLEDTFLLHFDSMQVNSLMK